MGANSIDLSAGLVPAQPAAKPTAPPPGGVDLSAGLQPAPPAAPPQPPAQPPAASMLHGLVDEFTRLPQTQTTIGAFKQAQQGLGGLLKILSSDVSGEGDVKLAARLMGQDPEAAAELARQNPAAQHIQKASDWLNKNTEMEGLWQHVGGFGENLAEFMGPEALASLGRVEKVGEVVQAATKAQKMIDAGKTAQIIEKLPPRLKSLIGIGMSALRSGAEAGAQTYVHTGGDATAAGESAAIGTVGTGAIEGTVKAAGAVARRIAQPSLATDAIEDAARSALEREGNATNATRVAPPPNPNAEPYTFKIQGTPTEDTTSGSIAQQPRKVQKGTRVLAGKGPSERQIWIDPATNVPHVADIGPLQEKPIPRVVIGDSIDHAATQANMPEVANGSARIFRSESGMHPEYVPEATHYADIPNTVGEGTTNPRASHRAPSYRLTEESRPGTVTREDSARGGGELLTQDPDVAAAHLKSLDQIIRSPEFAEMPPEQQQGYQAQRRDIQRQITEQYQAGRAAGTTQPNFEPIDVRGAVKSSHTFEDAADRLYESAQPIYEHANRVSGGQWQVLKDKMKEFGSQLAGEPNIPSNRATRAKLAQKLRETSNAMSRILDDPANGIDRNDADRAIRMMHAQFVLNDAHKVIEPIYDIEQHLPLRAGEYKGFNGNRLGARWQAFLRERPEARELLGADHVDTLSRMFKETETWAARKRLGQGILAIASAVGGGTVGALTHGSVGALEGGAAGELSYMGLRHVVEGMVMNPRFAKSLLFAVDSGARPKNYAPGLARMLTTSHQVARVAVPAAASAAVRSNSIPKPQGQEP